MAGLDDFLVVIGGDDEQNERVKQAIVRKMGGVVEVWGKDDGFCAWCVDGAVGTPIWEYAVDSQGENVKYACCEQCAREREVVKEMAR